MRGVRSLLLVVAACTAARPPFPGKAEATGFLVQAAAQDFASHPPAPGAVRAVRLGRQHSAGTEQVILCGEVLPEAQGQPEWTTFATIRTDPYEQWLGRQAKGACEDPSITWEPEDLSTALREELDRRR